MSEELEFRSAQLVDVSYPRRQIELIVMPYETEAEVAHDGRMITEICSRGAFAGVEKRTSRISVNVDHRLDVPSTIGRTMALHPGRPDGLIAEVKIVPGPLGDHALELAQDRSLGASAGFALLRDEATGKVKPKAEVWETRSRRRLNHLWLHHIALTPTPAYEGADVLDVRQTMPGERSVQSNRERLELQQLQQLYADIDRRYAAGQH